MTTFVQKRLACNNRVALKTTMKRLLLICVISLLFVSGWSHVLAAALCPNMRVASTCPMQKGNHPASSHEAMEMGEMGGMQMTQVVEEGEVTAVDPPMGSCPHCFSKSEYPTSVVVAIKGVGQPKRDLGVILRQTLKAITPLISSFAPPVSSRQHAPPQATTARHVLISVFLI